MEEQTIPTGQFVKTGDLIVKSLPETKPLSASYRLSPEQSAFFKRQIGITNDEELEKHIVDVQERAYKIFPYNCIKSMSFLHLAVSTLSVYDDIIKLGKERPNAIFLDIGACFGVDGRKVAADGFPLKNIINFDLEKGFNDLGHDLFKTTPASYPTNYIVGDAMDPHALQIVPPFDEEPPTEIPDLSTLESLNPLAGHCTVVHTSRFFHLFSEKNQLHLARAMAGLLSPQPGSIICGQHAGIEKKGILHGAYGGKEFDMFCHSPESWESLWDGEVFAKGKVNVDTKMVWIDERDGPKYWQVRPTVCNRNTRTEHPYASPSRMEQLERNPR